MIVGVCVLYEKDQRRHTGYEILTTSCGALCTFVESYVIEAVVFGLCKCVPHVKCFTREAFSLSFRASAFSARLIVQQSKTILARFGKLPNRQYFVCWSVEITNHLCFTWTELFKFATHCSRDSLSAARLHTNMSYCCETSERILCLNCNLRCRFWNMDYHITIHIVWLTHAIMIIVAKNKMK